MAAEECLIVQACATYDRFIVFQSQLSERNWVCPTVGRLINTDFWKNIRRYVEALSVHKPTLQNSLLLFSLGFSRAGGDYAFMGQTCDV